MLAESRASSQEQEQRSTTLLLYKQLHLEEPQGSLLCDPVVVVEGSHYGQVLV